MALFIMRGHLFRDSVLLLNSLQPEFLTVGAFDRGPEWNSPRVASPANRLYVVESGLATVQRGSRKTVLRGGHLYLLPLGPDYAFSCKKELHKIYFHFRLDAVPGIDVFQNVGRVVSAAIPPEVNPKQLRLHLARGNIEGHLRVAAMFHTCLLALPLPPLGLDLPPKSVLARYRPLFQQLMKWKYRDLRLKQLGRGVGLSEGAYSIRFKRDLGLPFKIWLDRAFLGRIVTALFQHDSTVRKLARDFGFSDEFQFSRWFKNVSGFSPKIFRMRFGEGVEGGPGPDGDLGGE